MDRTNISVYSYGNCSIANKTTNMQLSNITILALRGCDIEVKQKIADAAGVSIDTVYRWIKGNDDNLTKAAVLKVIREELGLSDSQILEETEVKAD